MFSFHCPPFVHVSMSAINDRVPVHVTDLGLLMLCMGLRLNLDHACRSILSALITFRDQKSLTKNKKKSIAGLINETYEETDIRFLQQARASVKIDDHTKNCGRETSVLNV